MWRGELRIEGHLSTRECMYYWSLHKYSFKQSDELCFLETEAAFICKGSQPEKISASLCIFSSVLVEPFEELFFKPYFVETKVPQNFWCW